MIASHLRPTVFVLLFALLAVSRGEEKHQNAVCNLCHCVQSEIADSEYTAIECRNVRATLYQEFEWPADAETIKRIKFRDMQSSILPMCVILILRLIHSLEYFYQFRFRYQRMCVCCDI